MAKSIKAHMCLKILDSGFWGRNCEESSRQHIHINSKHNLINSNDKTYFTIHLNNLQIPNSNISSQIYCIYKPEGKIAIE